MNDFFDKTNIFVDGNSSRILDILYSKYSNEYTVFFKHLLNKYSKGDTKKRISETIQLINKVKSLIEDMMLSGKVNKNQEKELYEIIDKIEYNKNNFIKLMDDTESFRKKINDVVETTGISIDQLNITKKVVKRRIRTGGRLGGKSLTFGGLFSKTSKNIGNVLEGVKVAATGPFYPLFNIAEGIIGDIANDFGKSGSNLINKSSGGSINHGKSLRTGIIGDSRQRNNNYEVISLFSFFNEKAYKAKWTKELIERIRKIQSSNFGAGRGLTFNLPTPASISNLFKYGIINGFKAAGLAGAFAFAGNQIYEAYSKSKNLSEIAEVASKSAKSLEKQTKGIESKIIELGGIEEYASKRGTSKSEIIEELTQNKYAAQNARKIEYAGTPYGKMESTFDSFGIFGKPFKKVQGVVEKITGFRPSRPEDKPISEIRREVTEKFNPIIKPLGSDDIKRFSDEMSRILSMEMSVGLKSISDSIKKVNEDRIGPVIKIPPIGNRYDAADSLINMYSNGLLTLGD